MSILKKAVVLNEMSENTNSFDLHSLFMVGYEKTELHFLEFATLHGSRIIDFVYGKREDLTNRKERPI